MKYGDKITKILANSGVISPIKVLMKSPKSRPISEGDLDLLKYRSQTSRAFTKHKTEVAITHVKHIVVNLSPSKSQIDLTKHVKAMSYRSRLLKNN